MRKIITNVDRENDIFYVIIDNKKVGFYLTNRLSKIFMPYLEEGVLVDFKINNHTKTFGKIKAYQVSYFEFIKKLKNNRIFYNHAKLKKDMAMFLNEESYYLFLDFEMTMPQYRQRKFIPEIIQYGYILTEHKGKVISEDSSYIFPIKQLPLSRRTKKFLNLDEEEFNLTAQPYTYFYDKLKDIIDKYDPKLVVWGKNDISTLNISYELHNLYPLTTENDFIDLLKLHKDYYNLRNDIGLFKAYEKYYENSPKQTHNAKEDAKITKGVFEAFVENMNKDILS